VYCRIHPAAKAAGILLALYKEMNAFTEYNCTCGESFTDQSEAIEHLVETTGEQPES
jgi:hypothetical protein